jgi:hypothetical protein
MEVLEENNTARKFEKHLLPSKPKRGLGSSQIRWK